MIHSGEGCVGCYKIDRGHEDMHFVVTKALMVFGIQDAGWQMFVGFFFDARLLQESTVGGDMARETASSRYAKWLRLLRRRIECKGVRVGRIHKLWTVYGLLVCVWLVVGDLGGRFGRWWCWSDAAGKLQSAAGADLAGLMVVLSVCVRCGGWVESGGGCWWREKESERRLTLG